MDHISPTEVISRGIVRLITDKEKQVQQVGIDLTLKYDTVVPRRGYANVEFNEEFCMQEYFGLLNVRSTYSRIGIFISAGVFDPGFVGIGGCTIYNMTDDSRTFPAGTRICQILVFRGENSSEYSGHYNNSLSINSKEDKL